MFDVTCWKILGCGGSKQGLSFWNSFFLKLKILKIRRNDGRPIAENESWRRQPNDNLLEKKPPQKTGSARGLGAVSLAPRKKKRKKEKVELKKKSIAPISIRSWGGRPIDPLHSPPDLHPQASYKRGYSPPRVACSSRVGEIGFVFSFPLWCVFLPVRGGRVCCVRDFFGFLLVGLVSCCACWGF